MPTPPTDLRLFSSLLEVVQSLRGPDGCPWDKEQTHSTLTRYAIEEAHELAEAIDHGTREEFIDELGDLLLQVILHSEIARNEENFTIEDVIENLNKKMIRRHPHVFAKTEVSGTEEVMQNWQHIKAKEKANKPKLDTFDIPKNLPALLYSQKIGEKVAKNNFDWNNAKQVMTKVDEELKELKEAIKERNLENVKEELGDLLFTLPQLARHLDIDSEQALRQANHKFSKRYFLMLGKIKKDTKNILELSNAELESYWAQAKLELDSQHEE